MDLNIQLFSYILKHDWNNFKKIVEETKDIDLNIRDDSNNYLIQFIIIYNQVNLIDLLISKKCKIDIIDSDGHSLLFYAIKFNYFSILEKLLNVNYIGFPLIELKDKNKMYPIHYAVIFNNLKILELLVAKNSNINLKDGSEMTPLMLAIKYKNINIIKYLLKNDNLNINQTNNEGHSALHIACNYENENIVELLLENKKIDVNVQDNQNKYTALMYSVALNNYNITNMILNNSNINLDIQDGYGNTVIHHAIKENVSMSIIELLDQKIENKKIYNTTNINGMTILHLLLENDIQINLKKYIENTNLNIQNYEGNTIWHLIGKRWINYITELEIKKNNVFIKNRKNLIAFDMYKENDKFIEMLIKSYYNYLKTKKIEWKEDWENICSKNDLIKKIDFKDNSNEKNCFEKIKKHILENKISVPYKKNANLYCVTINNNIITDYITYTGTSLDILIGMVFLKQFENVSTSLTKKFIINEDLSNYYKVLGIIKEIKGEYMNFEITWLYQKLFYPTNFDSTIQTFIESKKRFLVIPIGIHQDNGAHANILLYDSELNEIERFEPSGSDYPIQFNYNPDLLDFYLENYFKEKIKNIKYFKPTTYEMTVGFQSMEIFDINKKIGDPNGFCGAWSLWWVYMRIKHSTINRQKLFIQLVKTIRKNNLSFKHVIRSFSKEIIDIRDNLLKKVSLDINKWLNDDFDFDTFDRFNTILEKNI
jgi:ankyrin repeat protein